MSARRRHNDGATSIRAVGAGAMVVTGSPTAVEVGGAGVDSEVAVGEAEVLVTAGSTEVVLEAEVSAGSDGSRGSESARFAVRVCVSAPVGRQNLVAVPTQLERHQSNTSGFRHNSSLGAACCPACCSCGRCGRKLQVVYEPPESGTGVQVLSGS